MGLPGVKETGTCQAPIGLILGNNTTPGIQCLVNLGKNPAGSHFAAKDILVEMGLIPGIGRFKDKPYHSLPVGVLHSAQLDG